MNSFVFISMYLKKETNFLKMVHDRSKVAPGIFLLGCIFCFVSSAKGNVTANFIVVKNSTCFGCKLF